MEDGQATGSRGEVLFCRANTVDRWIWGYSSFGQTSTHTVTYQFDGKYCMIYIYIHMKYGIRHRNIYEVLQQHHTPN